MKLRKLSYVFVLALLAPAASMADDLGFEQEEEVKITLRQVGSAPKQPAQRTRVDVVSLRGDPNFLDREIHEIEKRDSQRLVRKAREPVAVQGLEPRIVKRPGLARARVVTVAPTRTVASITPAPSQNAPIPKQLSGLRQLKKRNAKLSPLSPSESK